MAYDRLPADLPARLRAAGLTVVEVPGWKTRGRPARTGNFDPVGVLWHHTGSYDGLADAKSDLDYAEWLAKTGRPSDGLPAPLCQLSVSAEGVVYVCASGRANHAGKARASGSVAAGDGNALYVGVECMNSGTQGWGPKQYDAMIKLGVVLGEVVDCSVNAQRGHKETSVTGKWDPGKLDMDKFRSEIAAAARVKPAGKKPALIPRRVKVAKAPARKTPNTDGKVTRWLKKGHLVIPRGRRFRDGRWFIKTLHGDWVSLTKLRKA